MEQKTNIYQKLLAIQKHISGLSKDKKSNNYSYVTGDKLLSYIKPIMNEQGLLLKQEIISIENTRMDYKTGIGTSYEKDKSEISSKVMFRFTWVDCETGEKDENLFGANGQNDWDKGVGSALTYGERYFLLKYFHIATDEDDIDNPAKDKVDTTPNTPAQKLPVAPPIKPPLTLDEAKTKAKGLFKEQDFSKVLAVLIKDYKLTKYTKLEDFIAGESIDVIREIYTKVTAKK